MSSGEGVPMEATYRTELSQDIKHVQPHHSLSPAKFTQTHLHTQTQIADTHQQAGTNFMFHSFFSLCPSHTIFIFYTQT